MTEEERQKQLKMSAQKLKLKQEIDRQFQAFDKINNSTHNDISDTDKVQIEAIKGIFMENHSIQN